jgi:Family of unknown function (DUF6518)
VKKIFFYLLIIFIAGILLGVITSFGQTYIPQPFTQLANSYSIWLLFSFVVGYILKSYKIVASLVAGVLIQYIAILFYYVASAIRFDMPFTSESLITLNIVWIIGGTLVGPIAALAGLFVANGSKNLPVAIGFMAGLFFSESAYQFVQLGYMAEGIIFSATGILFLAIAYSKTKFPVIKTLVAAIFFTGLMYIGFAYILGAIFA